MFAQIETIHAIYHRCEILSQTPRKLKVTFNRPEKIKGKIVWLPHNEEIDCEDIIYFRTFID